MSCLSCSAHAVDSTLLPYVPRTTSFKERLRCLFHTDRTLPSAREQRAAWSSLIVDHLAVGTFGHHVEPLIVSQLEANRVSSQVPDAFLAALKRQAARTAQHIGIHKLPDLNQAHLEEFKTLEDGDCMGIELGTRIGHHYVAGLIQRHGDTYTMLVSDTGGVASDYHTVVVGPKGRLDMQVVLEISLITREALEEFIERLVGLHSQRLAQTELDAAPYLEEPGAIHKVLYERLIPALGGRLECSFDDRYWRKPQRGGSCVGQGLLGLVQACLPREGYEIFERKLQEQGIRVLCQNIASGRDASYRTKSVALDALRFLPDLDPEALQALGRTARCYQRMPPVHNAVDMLSQIVGCLRARHIPEARALLEYLYTQKPLDWTQLSHRQRWKLKVCIARFNRYLNTQSDCATSRRDLLAGAYQRLDVLDLETGVINYLESMTQDLPEELKSCSWARAEARYVSRELDAFFPGTPWARSLAQQRVGWPGTLLKEDLPPLIRNRVQRSGSYWTPKERNDRRVLVELILAHKELPGEASIHGFLSLQYYLERLMAMMETVPVSLWAEDTRQRLTVLFETFGAQLEDGGLRTAVYDVVIGVLLYKLRGKAGGAVKLKPRIEEKLDTVQRAFRKRNLHLYHSV